MRLLFVVSVLPIVLFLILLLWKKLSLLVVSYMTLASALVLAFLYWGISPPLVLNSFVKAFRTAFDILIIVFGAILFLQVVERKKIIENICKVLGDFSSDIRVKTIILAWFFLGFLEGTAGFGTPAVVVAPLLVGLGLNPVTAVILTMLGNSTPTVFGAVGTPIRVGFFGLDVGRVPLYTALFNLVGFFVPVAMLFVLSLSQKDRSKFFWDGVPFAVWSGAAFVLATLPAVFLGAEFPTILGAVIGGGAVLITTRLGIFVPRNKVISQNLVSSDIKLPLIKVVFPYLLLVILLVVGKFILSPLNLFNPGIAFILVGILLTFSFDETKESFKRSAEPFLVIFALAALTQLTLITSIGALAGSLGGVMLPFVTPVLGAFGSFLTGSATISNIMFGRVVAIASISAGFDSAKILALLLVGASGGSMIALGDMLAVQAVVGVKNKERKILKAVIIPCLIYIFLAGIVGLLVT